MKRGRQHALFCLLVSVLSGGCGTDVNLLGEVTSHRGVRGRNLDAESVSAIVPGTTKKQEIVQRFGEPDAKTTNPDGTEQYSYEYTGYVETTNEKVVYAKKT